jgi:hypothetical protein
MPGERAEGKRSSPSGEVMDGNFLV